MRQKEMSLRRQINLLTNYTKKTSKFKLSVLNVWWKTKISRKWEIEPIISRDDENYTEEKVIAIFVIEKNKKEHMLNLKHVMLNLNNKYVSNQDSILLLEKLPNYFADLLQKYSRERYFGIFTTARPETGTHDYLKKYLEFSKDKSLTSKYWFQNGNIKNVILYKNL